MADQRPIRQRSANGKPKAGQFWRGCHTCDADFYELTTQTNERGIWSDAHGMRWYCSVECAPKTGGE